MSETLPEASVTDVTTSASEPQDGGATAANPTLGQIIFIKRTDPNTGAFGVEPAIVTETYDESDGEWTQGGAVVKLRSFNPDGADAVEQQGPATYDENDVWNGGYALTFDGPEVESLSKAVVTSPEVQTFQQPPSGMTAAQVQQMIEAQNNSLFTRLEGMLAGLAGQQQPAAPDPAANATPDPGSQSL